MRYAPAPVRSDCTRYKAWVLKFSLWCNVRIPKEKFCYQIHWKGTREQTFSKSCIVGLTIPSSQRCIQNARMLGWNRYPCAQTFIGEPSELHSHLDLAFASTVLRHHRPTLLNIQQLMTLMYKPQFPDETQLTQSFEDYRSGWVWLLKSSW